MYPHTRHTFGGLGADAVRRAKQCTPASRQTHALAPIQATSEQPRIGRRVPPARPNTPHKNNGSHTALSNKKPRINLFCRPELQAHHTLMPMAMQDAEAPRYERKFGAIFYEGRKHHAKHAARYQHGMFHIPDRDRRHDYQPRITSQMQWSTAEIQNNYKVVCSFTSRHIARRKAPVRE